MWGVGLIVLIIILVFVGMSGGGGKFIYVPPEESWRKVYRDTVVNPKKEKATNAPSKMMFFFGVAFVAIAILLVVFL